MRRHDDRLVTLGPATAALARLKGEFRCHVLLKDLKKSEPSGRAFRSALEGAVRDHAGSAAGKRKSVNISIDIDPVGMM
jgi:primosomal protein N'